MCLLHIYVLRRPGQPVSRVICRGGAALITRDQGLYLRTMPTGKERSLVITPSGSFVAFPAWSPDGKRFAYTIVTPFAGRVDGGIADWGGDLYVADANDGHRRLLV